MKAFIYEKQKGRFLYKFSGNYDIVLLSIADDKDFTLTPPPDYQKPWYWVDAEWTTEPAN